MADNHGLITRRDPKRTVFQQQQKEVLSTQTPAESSHHGDPQLSSHGATDEHNLPGNRPTDCTQLAMDSQGDGVRIDAIQPGDSRGVLRARDNTVRDVASKRQKSEGKQVAMSQISTSIAASTRFMPVKPRLKGFFRLIGHVAETYQPMMDLDRNFKHKDFRKVCSNVAAQLVLQVVARSNQKFSIGQVVRHEITAEVPDVVALAIGGFSSVERDGVTYVVDSEYIDCAIERWRRAEGLSPLSVSDTVEWEQILTFIRKRVKRDPFTSTISSQSLLLTTVVGGPEDYWSNAGVLVASSVVLSRRFELLAGAVRFYHGDIIGKPFGIVVPFLDSAEKFLLAGYVTCKYSTRVVSVHDMDFELRA